MSLLPAFSQLATLQEVAVELEQEELNPPTNAHKVCKKRMEHLDG